MPASSIHVSSAHLSEIEQKVFTVAINIISDEHGKNYLAIKDNPKSEILVLDHDTEEGKQLLSNASDNQVKIVFSSGAITGKNLISLTKPIRVLPLKNVLLKVCQQLYSYYSEHDKNPEKNHEASHQAPTENTHQEINASFSENIFLEFLKAKSDSSCLHMTSAGLPDIYVDGENKIFVIATNSDDIDKYFSNNFEEVCLKKISHEEFNKNTVNMKISSLDSILWRCALTCSRGQLIPGHTVETPVKLVSWPNFSREGFKPEYFKLAAILAKQFISLASLSKQVEKPIEGIIDFYNAAFAVGIIELGDKNSINKSTAKTNKKRKTILSKLAQRLGIA